MHETTTAWPDGNHTRNHKPPTDPLDAPPDTDLYCRGAVEPGCCVSGCMLVCGHVKKRPPKNICDFFEICVARWFCLRYGRVYG